MAWGAQEVEQNLLAVDRKHGQARCLGAGDEVAQEAQAP